MRGAEPATPVVLDGALSSAASTSLSIYRPKPPRMPPAEPDNHSGGRCLTMPATVLVPTVPVVVPEPVDVRSRSHGLDEVD